MATRERRVGMCKSRMSKPEIEIAAGGAIERRVVVGLVGG